MLFNAVENCGDELYVLFDVARRLLPLELMIVLRKSQQLSDIFQTTCPTTYGPIDHEALTALMGAFISEDMVEEGGHCFRHTCMILAGPVGRYPF
jgi:hypothetical protein